MIDLDYDFRVLDAFMGVELGEHEDCCGAEAPGHNAATDSLPCTRAAGHPGYCVAVSTDGRALEIFETQGLD